MLFCRPLHWKINTPFLYALLLDNMAIMSKPGAQQKWLRAKVQSYEGGPRSNLKLPTDWLKKWGRATKSILQCLSPKAKLRELIASCGVGSDARTWLAGGTRHYCSVVLLHQILLCQPVNATTLFSCLKARQATNRSVTVHVAARAGCAIVL